jgi:hypothetical protein
MVCCLDASAEVIVKKNIELESCVLNSFGVLVYLKKEDNTLYPVLLSCPICSLDSTFKLIFVIMLSFFQLYDTTSS